MPQQSGRLMTLLGSCSGSGLFAVRIVAMLLALGLGLSSAAIAQDPGPYAGSNPDGYPSAAKCGYKQG